MDEMERRNDARGETLQTWVSVFASEGATLLAPIPVVVEHDGEWSVSWLETQIVGIGESLHEAFERFEEEVLELASELLESDDSALGSAPRRWKAVILKVVQVG